jgi:lysine-specific demethylase 8
MRVGHMNHRCCTRSNTRACFERVDCMREAADNHSVEHERTSAETSWALGYDRRVTFDVIQYADLDQFHDRYFARNQPAVLRGIREHRALKIFRWSTEYWEAVMGQRTVPVMLTKTGFLSYERSFVQMQFGEFARRVFEPDAKTGARYYYKNPTDLLPQGHDDSASIEALSPYIRKAVSKNLWISSSGLTVGLHFDPADNLNFQLRGRKAFWLYPPGTSAYYPLSMFSQTAMISGVYRKGPRPDLRAFPRFDPSAGVRVELQEGDVLYLPAYWWHQVESLGRENVNLNFWWLPTLRKQLANWNQALRGHLQVAIRYTKYGNIQQAPADKTAE